MIKMTLVSDSSGKLVAAVQGHTLTHKHGNAEAGVSFHPNQKVHKVEVEDDIGKLTDAKEFQRRVQIHIPKS
jgi:hypothetical protein